MEIIINYYSPSFFSCIVASFLAFLVLFRGHRLNLNALFGVLSVLASIWFFFLYLYLPDENKYAEMAIYVTALPAIVSYFLFLLLYYQKTSKGNLKKIFEGLPSFSPLISFVLGLEASLVGLMLFIYTLSTTKLSWLLVVPETFREISTTLTTALSSIVLGESALLAFFLVIHLIPKAKNFQTKKINCWLAFATGLLWFFFSLAYLLLTMAGVFDSSSQQHLFSIRLLAIALLSIILIQSLVVTQFYYLGSKVLTTQLVGTLIIMSNLVSIFNSSGPEETLLRAALVLILALLSHLLVKSVISEIQKKQRVQKTAKEIYEANRALHKLDRAKSDFINAASHQLRSPLSVVKGIASMLIDGSYGKVSSPIKDALNKVYISNERLIGLIEDLLDISHLEEGKVDFNFEKKDLNEIAKKSIGGLGLQAQNKKLFLKYSPCHKSNLLVWADEQKVTEAISNLIDNAIKYTRKGGVKVIVEKSGSKARVLVKDTGIGLRREEIKNLFQKFVRAGRGNKMSTAGTGLGLYVVRKMIEAHKGKIFAESPGEGRGSTFIIELPLNLKNPPDEKFIKQIVMDKKMA